MAGTPYETDPVFVCTYKPKGLITMLEQSCARNDERSNPADMRSFAETLEQSRWLETDIRCKTEQLTALQEMAGKITSTFSDVKSGSRIQQDVMANAVANIVDLEKNISESVCQLMQTHSELMGCFDCLKSPESRTILQLRYLNNKTWKEIAAIMDCSVKTVYRKHKCALEELKGKEHQKRESA